MSSQKKQIQNPSLSANHLPETGAEDEIDQIINEIEELQHEMEETAPAAAAAPLPPKLKAVPPPKAAPPAKQVAQVAVVPEASIEESPSEIQEPEIHEEDVLSELRAGAQTDHEEGGMEDNLVEMKDESEELLKAAPEAEIDPTEDTEFIDETLPEATEELTVEDETSELVEEMDESMQEEVDHLMHVAGSENSVVEEAEPNPVSTSQGEDMSFKKGFRSETSSAPDAEGGTLTMTLKGNMTLHLKYDFDGQEVVVGFSEQCLCVRLGDGTEFKIPVNRGNAKKAA